MTSNGSQNLENLRHSCAHLLAAAVMELWPNTKRTIGPAIENGFYYDFDFQKPITEKDLPKIEKQMAQILPTWKSFQREEVTQEQARKRFKDNSYKLELIEELAKAGQTITIYKSGDFADLCRGGHLDNPSKEIGAFKLLSIAGAYWRGSEKNPMLTRIYGTCFPTSKELDDYLEKVEEAKKRDHRKIGKDLDLFSFHQEAPGFVFWHPKGMLLREALMNVYNNLHKEANYQLVSTPILLSAELWQKSGHWDHYKDKMYFTKIENKTFALKPMNCPGTSLIYKNSIHSYRELPLRLAEAGEVHRFEPSGTLHGLFRVRAFRQDDAHIYVSEDQIEDEVKNIIKLTLKFYDILGFTDIDIELSTRPEKYMGRLQIWDKAENILKKLLNDLNLKYKINEGEGSFYGPKIDFHIKDALTRSWQCGTIQLDFFMPERFELEYIDKDSLPKHPVMIHRTVIGSIQRFVGILIEHFGGAFPVWLSPVQVIVLPISDKFRDYAKKVKDALDKTNIRAKIDERNETLQAKIRDATLQKIPYLVIIGTKEQESDKVAIRTREGKDLGQMPINQFVNKITGEIENKS